MWGVGALFGALLPVGRFGHRAVITATNLDFERRAHVNQVQGRVLGSMNATLGGIDRCRKSSKLSFGIPMMKTK